jgi:serine/threonine-protein kinase
VRAKLPERIRLGSYEPLVELATGGMATVYVARQLGAAGFERLVAVKRVHRHLVGNREFYDMFRDEARVSSLIRHANVVSATDVVEWSGELFLVMDYVESVSLARVRGEEPVQFPPAIASRILVDVLGGLDAAHEALDLRGERLEVIHRDVSPQNVILGTDGVSRLIDFGIAKAAARLAQTSSGALRGKLRYMSPEQVKQQPIDRRADLFAAGVVLYELLTGGRMFEGEDEGDIALAILIGEVRPPSRRSPAVSAALDEVLHRALERDRDRRFATAGEMQAALEQACPPASYREVAAFVLERAGAELEAQRRAVRDALDGASSGGSSSRSFPGTSRVPTEEDTAPAATTDAGSRARSRRAVPALLAVAMLAAGAGALFVLAPWRTTGRSAAGTSGGTKNPEPPTPLAATSLLAPAVDASAPFTAPSAVGSARGAISGGVNGRTGGSPGTVRPSAHPRPELHGNPYPR